MDGLNKYSLKLVAEDLCCPLHHIIMLFLMQESFPDSWKYSKVIPLYKKEDELLPKNYRPVSILSPLSKILEKVIYKQIYGYLTRNKILHPNLHGYRQNRSTLTALLQMYEKWVDASNKGQVSGAVFIDLSAAFDLVSAEILMKKLEIYKFGSCFQK